MEQRPSFWTVLKLWFFYFLPFLPAMPGIGAIEAIDCIFVQAFGRNKYTDGELGAALLSFRLKIGNMNDLDMLGMLKQAGFDPGDSNRALARYAMRLAHKYNVPVIAQWEVVYAIYELDFKWYVDNSHTVDCLWPPEEGYFATAHVKLASREKMRARGCKRPLELAHPAMITRAVPIIWGMGVLPVVEQIRFGQAQNHELWVWDENSVQAWTRSFNAWKIRELIGRMAHVLTHLPITRHIIFAIKPKLSASQQQMIPGNWIRFLPPRAMAA